MKKNFVRRPVSYTEMAGWLFADLLLGLAVIGLASQAGIPKVETPVLPTPTPKVDRVLNLVPLTKEFDVSGTLTTTSSRMDLKDNLRRSAFARLNREQKVAGFVMIFAGGPSGTGSTEVSRNACKVLKATFPEMVARDTICKTYIQQNFANKIKIEMYTYDD